MALEASYITTSYVTALEASYVTTHYITASYVTDLKESPLAHLRTGLFSQEEPGSAFGSQAGNLFDSPPPYPPPARKPS